MPIPKTLSARETIVVSIMLLLCAVACIPAQDRTIAPTDSVEVPKETYDVALEGVAVTPMPTLAIVPAETDTPATVPPTGLLSVTATVPADPPSTPPPPAALPTCGPDSGINARFVQDLGIADGREIPPGTPFPKIWVLQNTGTCVWPLGTTLVYISGDPLPGPQATPVQPTHPGEDVAVSITFTAPTLPGHYTSYWRLHAPETGLFGAVVFVDIVVSPDAPPLTLTPVPEATATCTPTPSPTATPEATARPATTCYTPDPCFHAIINQATPLGIHFRCATGPSQEVRGEIQAFWRDREVDASDPGTPSLVILREDIHRIYIIAARDADTHAVQVIPYDAAQAVAPNERAPACALLVPPEDHSIPTGRIGHVWCEHSLWVNVGWPREAAAPLSLKIQETENGALIQATEGGPVSLIAVDFYAMRAIIR